MKKRLLTLLALCLLATSCKGVTRTVRVTVTGEDGTPIKDADIWVAYLGYQKTTQKQGQSNEQGVFSATGSTPLRMGVRIAKDGYYETHSGRLSRTQDHDDLRPQGKTQPHSTLRQEVQRQTSGALKKKFGFDFQVGDWVSRRPKSRRGQR